MELPGRKIPVSSWPDLMSALHSVVPHQPDEGNHFRSPYVFRGVDDATWGLDTSLQRLLKPATSQGGKTIIERSLLRSFRKYANAGAFDKETEWYILAVAQHNGLPTRCLDWSASPLVAAHFACGDEKYKDKDGAIWCVDAGLLRDINEKTNPKLAKLTGIAWVYDTRLLEQSFADLNALDKTSKKGDLMFLWEPPSLDQRIASQSGMLSVMNSGTASQTDFLRKHSQGYPNRDLVLRIIIDKKMKSEARDMLDQNNVSERTLFPGLPGLCSWLKRYYGRAW